MRIKVQSYKKKRKEKRNRQRTRTRIFLLHLRSFNLCFRVFMGSGNLLCLTPLSTILQLYRVVVSFIGRGNQSKQPTHQKSLTTFITQSCAENTCPWARFELTTLTVIVTDCIGSKSKYHAITITTAFKFLDRQTTNSEALVVIMYLCCIVAYQCIPVFLFQHLATTDDYSTHTLGYQGKIYSHAYSWIHIKSNCNSLEFKSQGFKITTCILYLSDSFSHKESLIPDLPLATRAR